MAADRREEGQITEIMHPILFQWGPLQIRFYGLMYAIGITCALYMIRREVARRQIRLSEDDVINFVMVSVVGGIIGARAYYVAFNWAAYQANLWETLKIWHGGLAIHGGVMGGALTGWWFVRRHRLPFALMADLAAPPLILAQTFGRFGNFMNGDAHGMPTDLPWGIIFPPYSIAGQEFPNTPLHPVMLYEMALNFGIFLLLWNLRKSPWKNGFLFCLYCILYSIGRFVVSWFRADNLMLGSISMPHLISIVIVLAAGGLIIQQRLWERSREAEL